MTTTNWLGLTSADPSNLLNWDNGVPTSTVDAVIAGSQPMTLTADITAKTWDFSAYTGTFTPGAYTADRDLIANGSVTLGSGMTVADDGVLIRFDASGTLISAGKQIFRVEALSVITVTMGDDWLIQTLTMAGSSAQTLAMGTKKLTCNGAHAGSTGIACGPAQLTVTYSAGAEVHFEPTVNAIPFFELCTVQVIWPPTYINLAASTNYVGGYTAGSGADNNWKFDTLTVTKGSFRFPATPLGSAQTLTVVNDLSWVDGGIITGVGISGAKTPQVVVGGNFSATTSDLGSTHAWKLAVTGTNTATGSAVAYCNATVTALTVTNGTDGLNNTNVTFVEDNAAPVANAGVDQLVNTFLGIVLDGSGSTDDGHPSSPGAVAYLWSKVSGPGTVVFADATAAETTCSVSANGTYVLRLTVDDSDLDDTDDVTIVVNAAPVVDAGIDFVTGLLTGIVLNGSVVDDDALVDPVASLWTKVSGPGTVTFVDDEDPTTTVTFSVIGAYVLRLTADDGDLTAADDIRIVAVDLTAQAPQSSDVGHHVGHHHGY